MLTLTGEAARFCDGVSRRTFLQAGVLSLGGLTLPQLLALRARAVRAGEPIKKTSVIFLELAGGPTHFETYDPKPDSPSEYRGPLKSIPTRLPGVRFSELMVEQAKTADKLAVIRSVRHDSNSHDTSSHLTQTGYYKTTRKGGENTAPCAGSVAAQLRGANQPGIPAYVAVPRTMRNGNAAYLGKGLNPFVTGGDPNNRNFDVRNLTLVGGLTLEKLADRKRLLASLNDSRRLYDLEGSSIAQDQFSRQAFEMVTGEEARRAFDVNREEPRVRDRYGRSTVGQGMLLARRLIEAGVTFVTVRVTGWDDHRDIAKRMEDKGPDYDRGVAALVTDLHERGLDRDVLVVAMGEFGRTPRVNRTAGRDHWGRVMSVLLACGGLNVGQIIGASSSKGEVPAADPYRPEHVLAMVYRHLGIDTEHTFPDFAGRPRFVLEDRKLVTALV